jgi:hypothetical protein
MKNVVYDIDMHVPDYQSSDLREALVAKNGTDFQKFNFSQNGIYRMHLYVRGVSNSSLPTHIDDTLVGNADGYVFVVPEFPFAIPMLAIGFASLIVFYRIKSKF